MQIKALICYFQNEYLTISKIKLNFKAIWWYSILFSSGCFKY